MNYLTLDPPRKWQAGTVGEEPFYFGCADCGAREPCIAGIIASPDFDGSILSVGLLMETTKSIDGPGLRPAVFCAECFAERLKGQPPRPWNPPPPESWPELKHHPIVRTCSKFRWNVFGDHIDGEKPDLFRSWDAFSAALRRRVARVIERHLERGGTVIEGQQTEWKVTKHRNAQEVGAHVASRVVGFGFSIALKP